MVQQFLSRFNSKLKDEIIRVQKLLGERAVNTFWPAIEEMVRKQLKFQEKEIGQDLKARLKVREVNEVKAFPFVHNGDFYQEHTKLTEEEAKKLCA